MLSAQEAWPDAPPHDAQQWTAIVPPGLPARSPQADQAPPEAISNDERGTEQDIASGPPRTNPVGCTDAAINAVTSPATTEAPPVQFPLPESNPTTLETRTNASPNRESDQGQWQSPLTRSKPPQAPENPQKSAEHWPKSRARNTGVSYLDARKSRTKLSKRSKNRHSDCSTGSSYQPSARGLWLRGSIYQFRVSPRYAMANREKYIGGKNAGSTTDRWL